MKTKLFLVSAFSVLHSAFCLAQTSRLATETAGNWGSTNVAHTGSLTITGSQTNSGNLQSATINTTGAATFGGDVSITGTKINIPTTLNSSAGNFYFQFFSSGSAYFISPTLFRATADVASDLGAPAQRWKTIYASNIVQTGMGGGTYSGSLTTSNGLCLPSLTNSPPAMSGFGAHLWSDGTNLVVIIGNHGTGTYTTNKVTLSTWP